MKSRTLTSLISSNQMRIRKMIMHNWLMTLKRTGDKVNKPGMDRKNRRIRYDEGLAN